MQDLRELTDLQLMLLGALWDRREATIGEIHERLPASAEVSRKTVATLLSRLEARGLVRHRVEGRENVYQAAVPRQRVLLSRVSSLLGALFHGDPHAASVAALDASQVHAGDVERVRALLRRLEHDVAGNGEEGGA
jgi:BlaI family penicillinase repressor